VKLRLSREEEAFREEVRAFIAESLPADIRERVESGRKPGRDDFVRWQKILHRKGWIAPHWPVEHGGTGWSPMKRYLFEEELGAAPGPYLIRFGLLMVGPVLMTFGSEEQKKLYLPRILASDDWWCQGYSEPGSGSDLASLSTRAVLEGDHYLVNGHKTWVTMAQHANRMFFLARTSERARKQEGISFLLVDMESPGLTVRPIVTFDGGDEINEVIFDDVKVPHENLVGEEGKGWTYAKFLLGHERTGIAHVGAAKRWLARVKELARTSPSGDATRAERESFGRRVARVEVRLLALESVVLGVIAEESAGRAPGPEASLLKLVATEIQQELTELMLDAVGPYALAYRKEMLRDGGGDETGIPTGAAVVAPLYFNWRKASIYAGTNEIQKNIIAKVVLGLPS
jgi:alkylation response protein AidB-like acyl-CoA dehydrogenase